MARKPTVEQTLRRLERARAILRTTLTPLASPLPYMARDNVAKACDHITAAIDWTTAHHKLPRRTP